MSVRALKVYGASKIDQWEVWLGLRASTPEIYWTARWPEVIKQRRGVDAIKGDPEFASRCWLTDFQDIRSSDALLVLPPPNINYHLRGALVEAGYALACGIPVYLLGDHPDFGSWQHHPMVTKCRNLDEWYYTVTKGMYS